MKSEDSAANENRKIPKKGEVFRNDSAYHDDKSASYDSEDESSKQLADSMVNSMEALLAAAKARNQLNTRRVIRPNHRSVTGWLANDVTGDAIPFESTLERDCAYIALFDKRVTEVRAQPVTIPYKLENGRKSQYTPDYEVTYRIDGRTQKAILEVKELKTFEENKASFLRKYDAAAKWCTDNDCSFYVVTERQLRPPLIENIRFLYRQRQQWHFDTLASGELLSNIQNQLPLTVEEILDSNSNTQIERAKTQTLLWGLIASRLVYVDLKKEIVPTTVVSNRRAAASRPMFFEPGESWK